MNVDDKLSELLTQLIKVDEKTNENLRPLLVGNVTTLDLFFVGILNRLLNINESYSLLTKSGNYLSAATLVRIQLDTLMRLNAINLVKDPFELAFKVLDGSEIKSLKDKDGQLMKDFYLRDKLAEQIPWAKNVYKEASGFVHFSEKHIFSNIKSLGDRKARIAISSKDNFIPIESKIEATQCMIEININVMNIFKGYLETKK